MAKDAVSSLLSYAGWAFLPQYATSFIQSLFYRITIRAGDPHPRPGSVQYTRHYRRIFIFVICSYLFYTLYESFVKIRSNGDFYSALGVLPTSGDRTIKSRFRRLAALHHPDKQLHGSNGENPEGIFVYLKLAQDTLLDPTRRFAYDRFGLDVVQGNKDKTISDYFFTGLYTLIPQYLGGFVMMIVLNIFWFSSWARYWRFYTFFALFTLELSLLTHPNGVFMPASFLPTWLSSFLNLDSFYLLPFQILTLARTASVSINIFISQLTPPEASSTDDSPLRYGGVHPRIQTQIIQLAHLTRAHDEAVSALLQSQLAPYKGNQESIETLQKKLKENLFHDSVRESPEVKAAIRRVKQRKAPDVT
ncbi:hypothetical protein FQN57_000757 [Myotisia sp. PD_48]|nr:hypothetical protein FQN57_000757 [Myotisia sp. PD_48]